MTREAIAVPIADIGELPADQYVGLIDDGAIACLTKRLGIEGLFTPVWLRRNGNAAHSPWSVIAGRHRLRAASRLGWTEIAAEQRADASSTPDELRRLQIAENLDRRTLRPIERALGMMCRWQDAATTLVPAAPDNQQSQAIRKRWDVTATMADTSAIDQATADLSGWSFRTVERYRKLHAALVIALPDLFAALNAHPLGESLSAMSRLATIKHDDARRKGAEAVLSRADWKSIDDALISVDLAQDKGFRVEPGKLGLVMMDAWVKMPLQGQRAHVEWLAEKVTHGMAVEMVATFKKRGLL